MLPANLVLLEHYWDSTERYLALFGTAKAAEAAGARWGLLHAGRWRQRRHLRRSMGVWKGAPGFNNFGSSFTISFIWNGRGLVGLCQLGGNRSRASTDALLSTDVKMLPVSTVRSHGESLFRSAPELLKNKLIFQVIDCLAGGKRSNYLHLHYLAILLFLLCCEGDSIHHGSQPHCG